MEGIFMTKLYRIVPDTAATLTTTGYISKITEDLLYKLNYIAQDNKRYFGIYQKGEGIVCNGEKMFFFTSPWSCIRALRFLDDLYSDKVARILEYEIPDNIVKSSRNAFTNYENWQAKGKLIPVKLLNNGKGIITGFNGEIKQQLGEIALSDATESLDALSSIYNNAEFDSKRDRLLERIQRVNTHRLEQNISFFETNMTTGKTMLITNKDNKCFNDVMYARCTKETLSEIIKKSNGILTLDSLDDFDYDVPTHQYGPIL